MSNLCFCLLGLVLGILMMAIIIVLGAGITFGYFFKRYWSTRHKINMKNRRYFPVKQQGAFAFTLRMLQSLSHSFRSVQAECQYELSTHPAWATCSSHFQTVLLLVPLRANASVLLSPLPPHPPLHLNKPHREAWQEMKRCHSLSVFPWTKIQSLVSWQKVQHTKCTCRSDLSD